MTLDARAHVMQHLEAAFDAQALTDALADALELLSLIASDELQQRARTVFDRLAGASKVARTNQSRAIMDLAAFLEAVEAQRAAILELHAIVRRCDADVQTPACDALINPSAPAERAAGEDAHE